MIFEMLKDLQENHRDDQTDTWILVWADTWGMWQCDLVKWDQSIPGWERGGPYKTFMDASPEGCVRQAWDNEKKKGKKGEKG